MILPAKHGRRHRRLALAVELHEDRTERVAVRAPIAAGVIGALAIHDVPKMGMSASASAASVNMTICVGTIHVLVTPCARMRSIMRGESKLGESGIELVGRSGGGGERVEPSTMARAGRRGA